MLATFTVTNLLDGPVTALGDLPGSLRQAIFDANNAPGADDIDLTSVSGTLLMTDGEFAITEALNILGPGRDVLTIDAQQQSRIFNVDDPSTTSESFDVSIEDLTLSSGLTSTTSLGDDSGGAIRSRTTGTLYIEDSLLTGNVAGSLNDFTTGDGGAIAALGDVSVTNSELSNNSTGSAAVIYQNSGHGGAIYSAGNVTITESTLHTNFTGDGNSLNGDGGSAGRGGAIYASGGVTLNDSELSLNRSGRGSRASFSAGGNGGSGGGIYAGAGASITDSILSGNRAGSGGAGDYGPGRPGHGGGLYSRGHVIVSGSEISNNSSGNGGTDIAVGAGGGIGGAPGGRGGGLFVAGTLDLSDSTITGNRTGGGGGGTYSAGPGGNGAGLYVAGAATITSSEFSGNQTGNGGSTQSGGFAGSGVGGGIDTRGPMSIYRSTFSGNEALQGGGIFSSGVGYLTVIDSVISGNLANQGGGILRQGSFHLTGSSVLNNSTRDGEDGFVNFYGYYPGTDGGSGGGISIAGFDGNTIEILNSTISGNSTGDGGDGYYSAPAGDGGSGAGIDIRSFGTFSVTISNSTISQNILGDGGSVGTSNPGASGQGAGISSAVLVTLVNTIVADNYSGPVLAASSDLTGPFDASYSLIGVDTNATITDLGGSQIGTTGSPIDPLLDLLNDNGGHTPTHALLPGSPALDMGDPTFTTPPVFDQRGISFDRVHNGRIDIGAYESQPLLADVDGDRFVTGLDFLQLQLSPTISAEHWIAQYGLTDLPLEQLSLHVNTSLDVVDRYDQLTSLREAVTYANLKPGADTINFDSLLIGVPIQVTAGEILISTELTIEGLGPNLLIIDAGDGPDGIFGTGDGHRIFRIDDGNSTRVSGLQVETFHVQINNLRLTGGDTPEQGGAILNRDHLTLYNTKVFDNAASSGGAIFNDTNNSVVNIVDSRFSGNSATFGGAIHNSDSELNISSSWLYSNTAGSHGGGIYNSSGQVSIANSQVNGNTAQSDGGAIHNSRIGRVTITNSTLSSNLALNNGGGLYVDRSTTTLFHTTVYQNDAGNDGGGLFIDSTSSSSAHVSVSNTILSGNTAPSNANLSGTLTTNTFNLIDIAPLLGPLQNNGGITLTHAPLPGSPTIDMGDPAFTVPPDNDQRGTGFDRVSGGRIDIGAYEVQPLLADVDSDNMVTGLDFLQLQITPTVALEQWEAEYGVSEPMAPPLSTALSAIPLPSLPHQGEGATLLPANTILALPDQAEAESVEAGRDQVQVAEPVDRVFESGEPVASESELVDSLILFAEVEEDTAIDEADVEEALAIVFA